VYKRQGCGIQLRDVYLGHGGVLTGAGRIAQEAQERAEAQERRQEIERMQREVERKKALIESQITALRIELATQQDELERIVARERSRLEHQAETTRTMARTRKSDHLPVQPVLQGEAGVLSGA
jgi:circadian clock protein KaiC